TGNSRTRGPCWPTWIRERREQGSSKSSERNAPADRDYHRTGDRAGGGRCRTRRAESGGGSDGGADYVVRNPPARTSWPSCIAMRSEVSTKNIGLFLAKSIAPFVKPPRDTIIPKSAAE